MRLYIRSCVTAVKHETHVAAAITLHFKQNFLQADYNIHVDV